MRLHSPEKYKLTNDADHFACFCLDALNSTLLNPINQRYRLLGLTLISGGLH